MHLGGWRIVGASCRAIPPVMGRQASTVLSRLVAGHRRDHVTGWVGYSPSTLEEACQPVCGPEGAGALRGELPPAHEISSGLISLSLFWCSAFSSASAAAASALFAAAASAAAMRAAPVASSETSECTVPMGCQGGEIARDCRVRLSNM